MKKAYITPDAEYVRFYTEEDVTLDVNDYAYDEDGDPRISGDYEIVEGDAGWT